MTHACEALTARFSNVHTRITKNIGCLIDVVPLHLISLSYVIPRYRLVLTCVQLQQKIYGRAVLIFAIPIPKQCLHSLK